MAKGRSISLSVPESLLGQIRQRSRINDRTFNAELRYLVDLGLSYAGPGDFVVEIPWVNVITPVTGRLNLQAYQMVVERSQEFHRGVGMEIVRLASYAIEETARRDLAIISAMMSPRDRRAPSAPQTAAI